MRLQTLYKIPCAQEREGRKETLLTTFIHPPRKGFFYKVESAAPVHFDAFDETDYERRTPGLWRARRPVVRRLWKRATVRTGGATVGALFDTKGQTCLAALPTRLPHVRARLVKMGINQEIGDVSEPKMDDDETWRAEKIRRTRSTLFTFWRRLESGARSSERKRGPSSSCCDSICLRRFGRRLRNSFLSTEYGCECVCDLLRREKLDDAALD